MAVLVFNDQSFGIFLLKQVIKSKLQWLGSVTRLNVNLSTFGSPVTEKFQLKKVIGKSNKQNSDSLFSELLYLYEKLQCQMTGNTFILQFFACSLNIPMLTMRSYISSLKSWIQVYTFKPFYA